jgi:hypothetical protein
MSEYQYYEFQALDRPLSDQEMRALRSLSTRAEITRTRFTNEYHWGDFKGNPLGLVEKYFDAFYYLANWGTHELMLRLPKSLLSPRTVSLYAGRDAYESFSFHSTDGFVILCLRAEDEDRSWDEDEPTLSDLLPLRAELLAGDQRCLYLGWLLRIQTGDEDPKAPEPPVPAGLAELSPSLSQLVEFLHIDPNLLEVASQFSQPLSQLASSATELKNWMNAQPEKRRATWLLDLVQEDDPYLRQKIVNEFQQEVAKTVHLSASKATRLRTATQLLQEAERLGIEKRRRKEEEKKRRRQEPRSSFSKIWLPGKQRFGDKSTISSTPRNPKVMMMPFNSLRIFAS